MLRRKIDDYIRHYYETTRNALLITGARQVGKTYSIRQFGRTFKSFVEINFVEMPEAIELFKGAKSSSDILLRLSVITSTPLIKGETLIFFDEVQLCPDIVTAIQFLADDGSSILSPPELNAKNKRFILKRLKEHAKFDRVENSFLWLTNAGVALPVYNVEEPKIPLLLSRSRNLFKLFQSDVGLLACQYAEGIQMRIIKGDKDINFGSIYENAVAQELVAHGIVPYYYNNKKRGELDFVIELGGKVLPIEVKSGKDYEAHRALSNIMDCAEYDLPEAIVFNNDNLRVAVKMVYAPIYMAMFLEKDNSAPSFYKVDLSGL